jgi:hypothetical protein
MHCIFVKYSGICHNSQNFEVFPTVTISKNKEQQRYLEAFIYSPFTD